ncbi:MAG: hypothetical protein ACE14L_06605 [Terriglobales bacterium]
MMLLITSNPRGNELVEALNKACGEQVEQATTLRSGMARVRQREFSTIIIDQTLLEPDPLAMDTLLHHSGTAVPIYLNFALSSTERLVHEVQTALRRGQAERNVALRAVSTALRNELKGALTGILLSSELALTVPELPPDAQIKIRFVHDLAESMRKQLDVNGRM